MDKETKTEKMHLKAEKVHEKAEKEHAKVERMHGKKIQLEFSEMTLWRLGTLVFGVLFVISLFTGGFGIGSPSEPTGGPTPPTLPTPPTPPQPLAKVDVSADNDPVLGDKNAPVQIIEFSDYQCPFCERFWQQTYPELKKKYFDTGKAYLVFRDFPLDFHPLALPAAIAAECSGEQGKYYEMHDKLFETQQSWSQGGGNDYFKTLAQQLKLDEKKFKDCVDTEKYKSEVQKDYQDGQKYGVQGTPTVFINGKMIVGAQPTQNFVQVIEAELGK